MGTEGNARVGVGVLPARLSAALSRGYVEQGEPISRSVFDTARRETLQAWIGRLIPGDEHWPSAGELDASSYVDAVVSGTPECRPLALRALAALESGAWERHGCAFGACSDEQKDALLGELSRGAHQTAFTLVLELTYEAYYRHPLVCEVMRERTGFDSRLPHLGSSMDPFDEASLDRVKTLPAHFREVAA